MSELVKKRYDYLQEIDEAIEIEDDAINIRSKMTIAAVAKLIDVLNENVTDMAEIATKAKYYDPNLTASLQATVSQLVTAFSQIQPPTINVTPNVKFDLALLQPVLNKLGDQNSTLINLVSKYNNNQNDALLRLITSVVERQIEYLDKEIKQLDYTKQLNGIETSLSKKTTEWEATVKSRDSLGGIEKLIIKSKN